MMVQSLEQIEKSNISIDTEDSKLPYNVEMLDRCKKVISKLVKKDSKLKVQIEDYVEELKARPHLGEKLFANFPGCRSIHFRGNSYRIIYRVLEPKKVILILEIGHRNSTYSELARILGQGK